MDDPVKKKQESKRDSFNLPDINVIKGVLAIIFGFFLFTMALSVIIKMVFFVSGLLLIFYGLQLLNIPTINKFLTSVKVYWQRLFY